MDKKAIEVIDNEIVPLVQQGIAVLFLGAGFTAGTQTVNNSSIPGSKELIKRILEASNVIDVDPDEIDLQTAFFVGEDEIDNFVGFLTENFLCKAPYDWQLIPFRHWWRRIYTTNIDTVIDRCLEINDSIHGGRIKYFINNYNDPIPLDTTPLSPPVVYLHGRIVAPEKGFVFDRISYADHSIKSNDWLRDAACYLSFGNCIIVGSRLNESDLETEMRKRAFWCEDPDDRLCPNRNYIVLPKFNIIEEKNYIKRGITPVVATAEDFFRRINEKVKPLSEAKILKRIAPHLRFEITDKESFIWFADSFAHVSTVTKKAKQKKGIYSRFFSGDMPDWFYIANHIPAKFNYLNDILKGINDFLKATDEIIFSISVTGKIASGKTTLCRTLVYELSKLIDATYEYESFDGIDLDALWNTIQNAKGPIVLYFDKSSEHFYAIEYITRKFQQEKIDGKLIVVIEEREILYDRNRHHLVHLTQKNHLHLEIPSLTKENAQLLYESLHNVRLMGGKLKNLSKTQAIDLICDTEKGYRGDLLATMVDITGQKSFQNQLKEEYEEIDNYDAKGIFKILSIVTAARLAMPISYLSEIMELPVSVIIPLLTKDLKGKIYVHSNNKYVSSRHHLIAEYHLAELMEDEEKKDCVIDLMSCVAKKFDIQIIKKHPLPYRIYKAIMHHEFLSEIMFPKNDYLIESIYSICQDYFKNDGIFWLQYGRFLYRKRRYLDAEHCFRKGLVIFDSFQIRHSLGQVLLKLYVKSNCAEVELFEEGYGLLSGEITFRGTTDPYPYVTLCHGLMDILLSGKYDDDMLDDLKRIANEGIKYHIEDKAFQGMIQRGMQHGFLGIG